MRKTFLAVFIITCILACKTHKKDLAGDDKVNIEEFLKAFNDISLPVAIADTALNEFGDTIVISKAVFEQFIPDSALKNFQGKAGQNLIIHPAGKMHNREKDFLLATFSSGKQIKLGVFVLNEKHVFLNSFLLLSNDENDKYNHSISITSEPAFIKKREKFTADNKSLYSRNGFAYNASSNSFAEILHDSNEDTARNSEIINPIDTLPSKGKYSGDYVTDKKNFISVRDGKNPTSYSFFIHFEKRNGSCNGELKGVMNMIDEKKAVFTESGDPCVINFKFSANSVTIKEEDNCGNHRGITCLFDFTFKKKKTGKKINTPKK